MKKKQTEKLAKLVKLDYVDHYHEHHKELDRFYHVAKHCITKENEAKVHDAAHHHIIDAHVNYDEA